DEVDARAAVATRKTSRRLHGDAVILSAIPPFTIGPAPEATRVLVRTVSPEHIASRRYSHRLRARWAVFLAPGQRRAAREEDRYTAVVHFAPLWVGSEPPRQAAFGTDPDQPDAQAVAQRVPGRSSLQSIHVFKDRLPAEELEAVVQVGAPGRAALGLD